MSESETVELPPTETTQPAPLDLLELNFTDECWLVVTDAQGDVLVTDLIQPGRELNLQGQAQFEVRMGNAHVVQLALNGNAYELDVSASTRLITVTVGVLIWLFTMHVVTPLHSSIFYTLIV